MFSDAVTCGAGLLDATKTRFVTATLTVIETVLEVLMPLIIPSTLFSGREELLDQVKILSEWPAHLPGYVIPYAQIPLVWKCLPEYHAYCP